MMRDVCALNGMIRKTGVNTIASTITSDAKSASQTSPRRSLARLESRVRTLGMIISSLTLYLSDHCHRPQHADGQKRKQVHQQIPATVTRWRGFDRRDCFRVSYRALQPHTHSPKLLRVEVHEGAILDLAGHSLALAHIKSFGQTTAGRLHAELYLQVGWKLSWWLGIDDHKEQGVANVRIGPE